MRETRASKRRSSSVGARTRGRSKRRRTEEGASSSQQGIPEAIPEAGAPLAPKRRNRRNSVSNRLRGNRSSSRRPRNDDAEEEEDTREEEENKINAEFGQGVEGEKEPETQPVSGEPEGYVNSENDIAPAALDNALAASEEKPSSCLALIWWIFKIVVTIVLIMIVIREGGRLVSEWDSYAFPFSSSQTCKMNYDELRQEGRLIFRDDFNEKLVDMINEKVDDKLIDLSKDLQTTLDDQREKSLKDKIAQTLQKGQEERIKKAMKPLMKDLEGYKNKMASNVLKESEKVIKPMVEKAFNTKLTELTKAMKAGDVNMEVVKAEFKKEIDSLKKLTDAHINGQIQKLKGDLDKMSKAISLVKKIAEMNKEFKIDMTKKFELFKKTELAKTSGLIDDLQKKLAKTLGDVEKLQAAKTQLSKKDVDLGKEIDQYKKKISDMENALKQASKARKEMQTSWKAVQKNIQTLEGMMKDLKNSDPKLYAELEKLKKSDVDSKALNDLSKLVASLKSKVEKGMVPQGDFEKVKSQLQKLEEAVKEASAKAESIEKNQDAEIENLKKLFKSVEAQIPPIQSKLAKLANAKAKPDVVHKTSSGKFVSENFFIQLIDDALEKYDQDKTGSFDYLQRSTLEQCKGTMNKKQTMSRPFDFLFRRHGKYCNSIVDHVDHPNNGWMVKPGGYQVRKFVEDSVIPKNISIEFPLHYRRRFSQYVPKEIKFGFETSTGEKSTPHKIVYDKEGPSLQHFDFNGVDGNLNAEIYKTFKISFGFGWNDNSPFSLIYRVRVHGELSTTGI